MLSQTCSLNQRQTLGLRQYRSQRQTLEQRLDLSLVAHQRQIDRNNEILADYISVGRSLWREPLLPHAQCPECEHKFNYAEIVMGFTPNPQDFQTTCPNPKCRFRFEPTIVLESAKNLGYPMLCAIQTLDQLKQTAPTRPEEFKKKLPSIYYSAVFHFGNLRSAYDKIGTTYEHDETSEVTWNKKSRFCLGKFRDSDIAILLGVKVEEVKFERKRLSINVSKKRLIFPHQLN